MRLAAALLVCLASVLIGFSQAAQLKKRKAALEELRKVIAEIGGLLRYENASTDAIFGRIGRLELTHLGAFFTNWRILGKRTDPMTALEKAAAELPEYFTKADGKLIRQLGAFLGRSDAQTQTNLCLQLEEKCGVLLDEYRRDRGNLAGLYQKLGVLIGIAAAILIL